MECGSIYHVQIPLIYTQTIYRPQALLLVQLVRVVRPQAQRARAVPLARMRAAALLRPGIGKIGQDGFRIKDQVPRSSVLWSICILIPEAEADGHGSWAMNVSSVRCAIGALIKYIALLVACPSVSGAFLCIGAGVPCGIFCWHMNQQNCMRTLTPFGVEQNVPVRGLAEDLWLVAKGWAIQAYTVARCAISMDCVI